MDSYSLGDLEKITRAKRRSIQLWADAGVIQAGRSTERAGTGIHREFSRDEAIVACIIRPFALRRMSIGELLFISGAIRTTLFAQRPLIEAAIDGRGETTLTCWWEEGEEEPASIRISSGKEIHFGSRRQRGTMCMAIRLETYLAGLK
jgi:hypothetical protein